MIIDIVNLNPGEGPIFGVWLEKGTCQTMSYEVNGQPDYTMKMQIPGLAAKIGYWIKESPEAEKVWSKAIEYLDMLLDDSDICTLFNHYDDLLAVRNAIHEQKITKQQVLFA